MRLGVLLILACITNVLQAQENDSIPLLNEISVNGNFEKQFLSGNAIILPKIEATSFYNGNNISEVLKQNSSIYFKEYGNGMLSTIAFRGTSASQTSVLWNNFNINNYTLGQTDFSLIPTQAIEEISIIPGSGSSMGGSGAFGGAVLLENNLSYKAANQIKINQEVGSFGFSNSYINASGSNGKWAYSTRTYFTNAKNDFEILQTGELQENAAYSKWGINQSIGYKIRNTESIKLSIWYNDNFREIQAPIGSSRDVNEQSDHNLRTHLNYEKNFKNGFLNVGTGYFIDELDYRLNDAISYYKVNRWESFSDYKIHFLNSHELKISARYNHIEAFNQNYENGQALEQRYSLKALLSGQINPKINYAVHLRQQYIPKQNIPISPYAGISSKIIDQSKHQLELKLNSSYNYRVPTLNDRFWNESDNSNLKSETAWNKEVSLNSNHKFTDLKVKSTITAFHNLVDNWIQWVPTVNNIWSPRNIKQVLTEGIEISTDFKWVFPSDFEVKSNLQYSYTSSTVMDSEVNPTEIGKQLIYTPINKATAFFSIRKHNFSFNTFHQLTGRVYTTSNNSEIFSLSPFYLTDIGLTWTPKNWEISTKIKNVLEQEYFLYSGFAMPGRNYQLSITKTFNIY
ncbi:TonB-dependent receptor plug domain-containing protein [Marivirga arenosa]|uniref:TonB-dependent receptor plug domain-containing protein n=1 Tax=Marivirga arenosa TaxID=3059076 RepID=A0AA51RDI5_9BACT|nr:TonB-dependent receptor [Marivirga sp. ABR2-2]WMN07220.1 TonB-dependent receptor plug domain-containing protein [Marivirga sp. ABR2-2]